MGALVISHHLPANYPLVLAFLCPVIKAHIIMTMFSSDSYKFLLLNSEGEPRSDCYLEFDMNSFPTDTNRNRGLAQYVSSSGEPDSIIFRFDSAKDLFVAWLENDVEKTFEMAPTCVGEEI